MLAGSRTTPYNTPPERRRENVYELGEVLEALQSVSLSYRRTSQPVSGGGGEGVCVCVCVWGGEGGRGVTVVYVYNHVREPRDRSAF